MARTHTFEGQCHCGAMRVVLVFTKPADQIQVRACQCGFCTRQGAMTVSDPQGKSTLSIREGQLHAYQFGTRTATSAGGRPTQAWLSRLRQSGVPGGRSR